MDGANHRSSSLNNSTRAPAKRGSRFAIEDVSEKNRCHYQFNNQVSFYAVKILPCFARGSFAERAGFKVPLYTCEERKEGATKKKLYKKIDKLEMSIVSQQYKIHGNLMIQNEK